MSKKISHLAIAVKNIETTTAVFAEAFDLSTPEILDFPDKKVKTALMDLGGISLEFLEEYDDSLPLGKLVAEQGNIIHHFCLETNDIEKEIADLKSRGVEMLHPEPKQGLRGKRIAFIHPDSLDGLMVELSEP